MGFRRVGESALRHALDLYQEDRVRLGEPDAMAELRADLLRAAYQVREVRLESGVEQPYYFDKYLMFARPAILRRLSRFLTARVPPGVERVASPTLGAVALGSAVSLESGLPLAIVRSAWHGSDDKNAVEGGLHPGESVALIEDVVVTGNRALNAVSTLRSVGAEVSVVLSVVDCERGAEQRMTSASVDYVPLFHSSSLIKRKDHE
jgi:orotate phosphoribosyltransferase